MGAVTESPPLSVLTVAGSDPSGGAGIQADLMVFSHLGLHGISVVTAITAQNTRGVQAVFPLGKELVATQLESVKSDFKPAAFKTGMLPTVDIIDELCSYIGDNRLGMLVVDPVLVSTSGSRLASKDCAPYLVDRLLPFCSLVTPNLFEAEVLSGRSIKTEADAQEAARALVDAGAAAACITGGHWPGNPVDFLFDGQIMHKFEGRRIEGARGQRATGEIHGTGCVFSAAATGFLARGFSSADAVANAKILTERAISGAISAGVGMKLPWLDKE